MLDIGFSADIRYSDVVQLLGRWDLEIVPNHRHLVLGASELVSDGKQPTSLVCCCWPDQISHRRIKTPRLLIDSRITPACIRSSGSDRILRSAQARDFFRGPWAGSRMTAAASFLRNHREKERHRASSLCNYHEHHIWNVQRCSFVSLFTPSFSNAEAAGDVKRSARGVSVTTRWNDYSATYRTGYDIRPRIWFSHRHVYSDNCSYLVE